ncbi:helix-turn-helix domain-containing protein [Pirellulaceae bacterium]|nr:helix-turn-helix domain-containing protein [Mariniblastus sp.]MDB4756426.1 helix-turn-helix domain-containing protein [Mariniblastus sp.]MDB4794333.1 helix-turn-helix domain-containing protein [Pirellulaceae bacterium]
MNEGKQVSIKREIAGAVSRTDAAKHLGISTRMLDELASKGRLRRLKIGRRSVFQLEDLNQFLNTCVESR